MKPFRILFTVTALCLTLSGCSELFPKAGQNINQPPPTRPPRDPNSVSSVLPEGWDATEPSIDYSAVEHLSMVVTEKTIKELDNYPNLKTLDLSGSTCYTALRVYAQNHPEVEVTYSVDFGGASAINWAENIVLQPDGIRFETVSKNLVFLPDLKSVHLPKTQLTLNQIELLRKTYPNIVFTYTVAYKDRELSADLTELNLAGISVDDIPELVPALERLPEVNYVELMNSSGSCSLTRQEVKQLVEALPTVRFHYIFNLFGKTVSTTDDLVSFKLLNLGANAENEIREALSIMAPGSTLVLDDCGLSSELLASIRDDFPDVELAWRVYFGTYKRYSYLTNTDTVRAVYNVTDDTCSEMKYMHKVKYMDLGHNDTLTDVSFVGYMPEIEILILSGCAASDLSGFENCKKLEFLELANCLKLSDLTPLAGCGNLKYLNICFTKVSSLMPLDGLGIKNLFCKQTRVPAAEQKQFKEIHENCTAVFTGRDPYAGPGWRYTDYGYTFTDFYKRVREVFNLDKVDQLLIAQQRAQGN